MLRIVKESDGLTREERCFFCERWFVAKKEAYAVYDDLLHKGWCCPYCVKKKPEALKKVLEKQADRLTEHVGYLMRLARGPIKTPGGDEDAGKSKSDRKIRPRNHRQP